ncbi:stage II sporulation protein M [Arenicella xantha]|uniref:Putative membrane protein SpoIIM required for sporulation n=1 Tax=Arenicella xantha TaxID=644221 RepID=A0A395JKR7_9GAMM|nr:stage II sporulation protein M [Arenicella xantha]RBP48302.1 putative membrane protein SpoIIM required for sporulation [Arenicella xantha]
MKQLEFERLHNDFWNRMQRILEGAEIIESERSTEFPSDYRRLCQHLAMAKSRRYAPGLTNRLNQLVGLGYQSLYGQRIKDHGQIVEFLVTGFPAALRSNAPYLWIAGALFVLPYLAMMIACLFNDQMLYSVMSAGEVRMMEAMYEPSVEKFGRESQASTDLWMFGFYIYNNIGIAFKCFATGLFAGVGSLFMLAYNGVVIGGVSGHLTALGYTETFYPFVIGHGSFELTAIAFSGAAGLKLGWALLAPGKHTRIKAMHYAAIDAIKIMYGVFIMLTIAAFLEAFWSASASIPIAVKYLVGAILWVAVYYYCFFFARAKVRLYIEHNAAR